MTASGRAFLLSVIACLLCNACTLHHTKQALATGGATSAGAESTFVTEEDSGLMLAGLFSLYEPDHYAVILERVRKRHRCARMHHAQLDFYTEHWIIVGFPITRMTLICEREREPASAPLAQR